MTLRRKRKSLRHQNDGIDTALMLLTMNNKENNIKETNKAHTPSPTGLLSGLDDMHVVQQLPPHYSSCYHITVIFHDNTPLKLATTL